MSNFSCNFYLNAYSDNNPSNQPSMNNFRWNRNINSVPAQNPTSLAFQLAPGESRLLFSGMRTLAQDSTTQYSLSLQPLTSNTYVLSAVAGTLPNFRTPRTTGASATTQVNVTLNGPVATFTSIAGIAASFTGQIPGMILPVTITANTFGTIGNSVVLPGDGTSSINTLISVWNTANPSNTVTLTAGNGTQVPDAGTYASFTGTILGTSTPVTITSNVLGTIGSTVFLVGDGTSSISTLIATWNTDNPSNTITLTSGDGTQIPAGGVKAHYTGIPAGLSTSITLTASNSGVNGNDITLIGDGTSSVDTLIANWNIMNPSNTMILSSGNGSQIPNILSVSILAGGVNPAMVNLTGGTYGDIVLSGGASPTPFNLISGGVQVGDFVQIGNILNPSLNVFSPNNWGTFQILAVTATSFSIDNGIAVAEGPITLGSDFANQIAIYSALGVQIGDTLDITGGFSQVTQGAYSITGVGANFLTFYSTAILPQQSNIMTEAINVYFMAKKFLYLESDQNCGLTFNGTLNDTIQPFVYPAFTQPGIMAKTATVYSLTIVNNSTNTANLFLATIE